MASRRPTWWWQACLQCILSQACRTESRLKVFALESVQGFGDCPKGGSGSPFSETISYWQRELGPAWFVWSWKVATLATGLPQGRERMFICGRKKELFLTPMPRRQPGDFLFRCVPLECILDAELPSDLGKLSDEMLENLRHFRDKHAGDPEGSIVCCDLTRAPGKKLAPVSRNGVCPTLTTRNLHVFVFQCKTNKYQRFLTARQRLML